MDYISMIAVGEVETFVVERTAAAVQEILGIPVRVRPGSLALPDFAYNPKRQQYCSTELLKYLRRERDHGAARSLGITDVDLYAPRLNYVFGEAMLHGPVGVISLIRLRPEFYGRPPDRSVFLRRVTIEAIHEIGHTLGLQHCPSPSCVMRFSTHIEDSDRKGFAFCRQCSPALAVALRAA